MEKDYLIQKKPFAALVLFSLPIVVGNLFQQTYTLADFAIVGRYVSQQALAAVGACNALTNIFICVAIGGGIGASVLVSRYFGAREHGKMVTAMYTILLVFLTLSIALGMFGLWQGRRIMVLLRTPEDVLDLAVEYLRIYFAGLPFLFMYNVLQAMFNALGRSRIPLVFLILSSLFNIALDWILVTRYGLGVAGVAWATLIAQSLSAVLSFFVLLAYLGKMGYRPDRAFERREVLPMLRIALPSILQQSAVSIGMLLVQSVVNRFGSEALAGFSAAMRVEALCVVPMTGIGNALSSYTAQNIGARKEARVTEGYRAANGLVLAGGAAIFLVLELFHRPIIALFLGSNGTETALDTGCGYLTFMGFFFCLIGFKMAVDGLLRGAGDMRMFTVANLANLGIRVAVAMAFAPRYGIAMVWYAVPLGWFVNWAISYAQYRTGKWRQIYQE